MLSFSIRRQNSGREHPGGSACQPDAMASAGCNGGSRVQFLPGYVVLMPSDGVSGRLVRVYSLHGFQRTLIHLRFALVIKKLSKHQNLTYFD